MEVTTHHKTNKQTIRASPASFHPYIRTIARVVSVIFHPLFIPVYIACFLIYTTSAFPGFDAKEKGLLVLRFFVMYTVFPLATILLAKGLGFIQSIYLHTQKDRIIPYIACGLYYFWMWYVLRNQPEFPRQLVMLSLAIFIASSAGLILNSYLKISMHALSLGVGVAFIYLVGFLSGTSFGIYISISLFIAGLVCSARLINSDHHPAEIYIGLVIGIASQLAAYWIV
jgi:hypothetical protein